MQFWSKMKYSKIMRWDWWHEIQQKWISISRRSWTPQVRGAPPSHQKPAQELKHLSLLPHSTVWKVTKRSSFRNSSQIGTVKLKHFGSIITKYVNQKDVC